MGVNRNFEEVLVFDGCSLPAFRHRGQTQGQPLILIDGSRHQEENQEQKSNVGHGTCIDLNMVSVSYKVGHVF